MNIDREIVLELIVNNHPGVMSHITGLFSRRGYNMEGILCGRIGKSGQSRVFLLLEEQERLEQIVRQLENLYDVDSVMLREDVAGESFRELDSLVKRRP